MAADGFFNLSAPHLLILPAQRISVSVNFKRLMLWMGICKLLEKKRDIPLEIDDHFKLYGKEPWEVEYGEKCPVCNVRIDEYGFCSCGSSGG